MINLSLGFVEELEKIVILRMGIDNSRRFAPGEYVFFWGFCAVSDSADKFLGVIRMNENEEETGTGNGNGNRF